MLHKIENDQLVCTIESVGAEIRSLKNKATGKEYIWQIDEKIWGSSSPVLFPAIGKIKEDKILFNGKDFGMTKHGIIRNNDQLTFKQISVSSCSFNLSTTEETIKKYPYQFSFTIEFALSENKLIMAYNIENLGSVPMQFACGGHTAYSCPLDKNTQLSDYIIEFPTPLNLQARTLGASGLLSDKLRNLESKDGALQLSNTLFNDDALIFANIKYDWVRLRKKVDKKGIKVRFSGYPNLALWSKPAADYICIEPWLGLPDREDESLDITKKTTYKSIEPNNLFSINIITEIE